MSDPSAIKEGDGTVVTVGTYDGVHRGHRRLIEAAKRDAATLGLTSVVVTFDRHPAAIVRPAATPRLLTSLDHKLELLRSTGVDEIVVLVFDEKRAAESAEDFVESVLVDQLGAREVLVGSNFRFGHRQRGDVRLLEELGPAYGFMAGGIELITDEETHTVVSSSRIRGLVANGALEEAERLLGRSHEVRGTVKQGSTRSRWSVDIPKEILVPKDGVYSVAFGPLRGATKRGKATITSSDDAMSDDLESASPMIFVVPDERDDTAELDTSSDEQVALKFLSGISGP